MTLSVRDDLHEEFPNKRAKQKSSGVFAGEGAPLLLEGSNHKLVAGSTTFLVEPLPPIDDLERVWRGLDRTGAHSFFVSWDWIGTLLRTSKRRPRLLQAMRAGEVVGLALLTIGSGRLRHLFPVRQAWLNATGDPSADSVMIEHNDFAVPSDIDGGLLPALVEWFADGGLAADELLTPGVAPDRAEASRLLLVEKQSAGYRTPLEGLGESGLAPLLSRNARQQLRRSLRDYGGCLSLDRASDRAMALEYFAKLKELHVLSWTRRGRSHAFGNPFFETFHRSLIEFGFADGSVDLLRVSSNDRILGYLYNFRRNGVVSSYQSGFADETPGFRPGYVCHALAIARYAQEGMRYYDFLSGSNRLKRSFGLETYALCWNQHRKPTAAFMADDWLRRAGEFARSHLSRAKKN